jgi:hypothetical protein
MRSRSANKFERFHGGNFLETRLCCFGARRSLFRLATHELADAIENRNRRGFITA